MMISAGGDRSFRRQTSKLLIHGRSPLERSQAAVPADAAGLRLRHVPRAGGECGTEESLFEARGRRRQRAFAAGTRGDRRTRARRGGKVPRAAAVRARDLRIDRDQASPGASAESGAMLVVPVQSMRASAISTTPPTSGMA